MKLCIVHTVTIMVHELLIVGQQMRVRVIRRRRECENCGFRFTTFERIEATPLLVIKKNGTREEFNREKILQGIVKTAKNGQIGMDVMTKLVDEVENEVRSLGEK